MVCSEVEGRCKTHPDHRQQEGICSSCLREKLSELSGGFPSFASQTKSTVQPLTSSSSSASSPTTGMSPVHHSRRRRHVRNASDLMESIGRSSKVGLRKSKSMAFVVQHGEVKKNGGFWSKLIGSTGKKRTK
ncbi:hypothetical protein RJ639_001028 [Escallonia herrerae]|uniref:Uncharacterized protein n=1 Tax=Escallonia herrerae TaxID=1293975 RepID=A0AA88XA93_9ASTE|nr:hypothetical protein RJ639_001028 [Escallonia herrerae]